MRGAVRAGLGRIAGEAGPTEREPGVVVTLPPETEGRSGARTVPISRVGKTPTGARVVTDCTVGAGVVVVREARRGKKGLNGDSESGGLVGLTYGFFKGRRKMLGSESGL